MSRPEKSLTAILFPYSAAEIHSKEDIYPMQENNTFMKTKPVFSLLVSMSVPMMLSMLIQSLYNIVDSIYVSRLCTAALTACSLPSPLTNYH